MAKSFLQSASGSFTGCTVHFISFDSKYKSVISILRSPVLGFVYQQINCSISLVHRYFSLVCKPA